MSKTKSFNPTDNIKIDILTANNKVVKEELSTDVSNYKYNCVDDSIIFNITKKVFESMAPAQNISIEDWAVEHRRVTDGSNQGPFNKDFVPYILRIFRCFLDPRIRKITLMWSTQLGKSFLIDTIIGYLIHIRPSPILYVLPDGDFIETYSTTKLKSLLEDTKVLRPLVQKAKPGRAGTKVDMIKFNSGFMRLASAGSISALSGQTIPNIFMDEASKYPRDLKNQGGSVDQAERRAGAYEDDVNIVISGSPGYSGVCAVEKSYLEGSQERYYVPCPHCNVPFVFDTKQMQWDKIEKNGKTIHLTEDTTRIQCPHCKGKILDIHKPQMLTKGEWVAENPDAPSNHVSFQCGIYYSPWTKFSQIAQDFISKSKTEEGLKIFTTLYEGLPFKPRSDQPEWKTIKDRAEPYPMLVIPKGVCFLTAGVDIQGNRIAVAIYGWGRGEQAWLIYYGEISETAERTLPWDELDELLSTQLKTADGVEIPISGVAVDSSDGNKTLEIYNFCRTRRHKGYFPIKGSSQHNAPIISSGKKQEVDARGKPLDGSIELFSVGTHLIKSTIYERLKNGTPGTPGYMHFYGSLDAEFYLMLTAEKLITTYDKGVATIKWEKTRKRNESLDCTAYAFACAHKLGIQRIMDKKWDRLEQRIYNKTTVLKDNTQTNISNAINRDKTPTVPQQKKKKLLSNDNYALSWKR